MRAQKSLRAHHPLLTLGILLLSMLYFLSAVPATGTHPSPQEARDQSKFPEKYKITASVLETLKQENLPISLFQQLQELRNQLYTSKPNFLAKLHNLEPPPTSEQESTILSAALLDKLMIRSEEFSGDLNAGEALFQGNVRGGFPRENVQFSAEKVRIQAESSNSYNKIIAENNVHVTQDDYSAKAGHAIYHRIQKKLNLTGRVELKGNDFFVKGASAEFNGTLQNAEIQGILTPTQQIPAKGSFQWTSSEKNPDTGTSVETLRHADVEAHRIFVEKLRQQALLEGSVLIKQKERELLLRAGKVLLMFDESQKLTQLIAERSICIEQPGRVARANKAHFDETKQTILLEGNAEAHSDEASISGETLMLHMDVSKGEVKGDSKTPIEVQISLDGDTYQPTPVPKPFNCQSP